MTGPTETPVASISDEVSRRPMKVKVGVMGGASDVTSPLHMEKAHAIGQAIAERGCILVTGACPGLPMAAACGAKQLGGLVLGISPASNVKEHVERYGSPTDFHDILVFTGAGLMGREVINIRSSDVVVILGGRSGTLGELAIAYDEGKPIGIVAEMGGISDIVPAIVAACGKATGARVTYDVDPRKLIDDLLRILDEGPLPGDRATALGEKVRDPVCGMLVLPQAVAAERTWQGVRFGFCSKECLRRFDEHPDQFTRITVPEALRG